ncbi:MAG TPA: hypothetical protein VFY29_11090 [Terriglobia bacterium]|nr:hypothetical protein [Terriglobia bacterium]
MQTSEPRRLVELEPLHAADINRLKRLIETISPTAVSHAFVASLSSRLLSARSALGSYAFARNMPAHKLRPIGGFAVICADCDWSLMPRGYESYNAEAKQHYVFERSRFGGVAHDRPQYALFDLENFIANDDPNPTDGDWRILAQILDAAQKLHAEGKASDLERAIKSLFRSNRYERRVVIQILAYSSVLEDPTHPGYLDSYVPPQQRSMPRYRFLDWGYPTIWWRAQCGVREDAVRFWFPELYGKWQARTRN